MKFLDEFLQIFGDIKLSQIVVVVLAFVFLFIVYKDIKKIIDAKIQEIQKREETEKAYKKKIEESYSITQKYPEYHRESIQIRDSLNKEIQEIRNCFNSVMERLEEIEKENKKRECSKLKDMLLQNYRYYTNLQQNPSQSWTRMESEAFWELFREYEATGGNGYMHTDVQPAMERLLIVDPGK